MNICFMSAFRSTLNPQGNNGNTLLISKFFENVTDICFVYVLDSGHDQKLDNMPVY